MRISEIDGKKLAKPLDLPDGLTDEQYGQLVDTYADAMQPAESPTGGKVARFASGALDMAKGIKNKVGTAYKGFDQGATSILSRLLNPVMTEEAREAHKQSEMAAQANSPGMFKAGEIAGDIGLTALPAGVGGKIAGKLLPEAAGVLGQAARAGGIALGQGAGSAATHAVADAASGEGADPGKFLTELVFSGLLGAGGNLAGQGMKAAAPAVLENLSKAKGALLDSKNPPTREGFELALDRDLIPSWGGFGKAADKTGEFLGERAQQRAGVLAATGKTVPVKTLISNSRRDLTNTMKYKTQGVTPADREAAQKWFQDAKELAESMPSYNPKTGEIGLEDAEKLKTSIMKNAKPVMAESQEGRKLASEHVGRGARNAVRKGMKGDVREDIFTQLDNEMRLLAPVNEALDSRKGSIPLWETITGVGSLGVGGGLAGSGNVTGGLLAAGLPLAALGLRHTPAPAALMYKGGKGLLAPSMRRDLAAQAIRSNAFGGR